MSNPIVVLIVVVSLAVLIMLGINLYYLLKPKKKESENEYAVLHQRFDSLAQTVNAQLERNRQASENVTLTVSQQVHGFTQGMAQGITSLQENLKQMHESVKTVSSFQDILKSPKLRGNWGELSLESLLKEYFSKDMYEMQHEFKSGEKVDAVLKLPNGLILPIDSKFSWENFRSMISAENEINKEISRKAFLSDVKKRIDEISKYILPAEGTVDWALMYVPAETVYYEIINNMKDVDVAAYGRTKKVMIMSPNTFYITLGAIMQWTKNIEFNKQASDIMKRLERIFTDSNKLTEEFRLLGKHISNASSAYKDSEDRLTKMVDKVKNVIEIGSPETEKEIEPPRV